MNEQSDINFDNGHQYNASVCHDSDVASDNEEDRKLDMNVSVVEISRFSYLIII